ncbi:hypothetical protein [Halovivax gelatinilyticus]|uniref:hypothetical protein n=1 Tax=Halovivax gelatinilyticus TaxID=2961597 RepID=UPI0020CA2827|nr:hypothetical protein [Halovivax gelatinilyticus]
MDDDTASRRSVLGLGGLAGICCLGPGTAAVSGGAAVGIRAGIVEALIIGLTLFLVGLVIRRRTGCDGCGS